MDKQKQYICLKELVSHINGTDIHCNPSQAIADIITKVIEQINAYHASIGTYQYVDYVRSNIGDHKELSIWWRGNVIMDSNHVGNLFFALDELHSKLSQNTDCVPIIQSKEYGSNAVLILIEKLNNCISTLDIAVNNPNVVTPPQIETVIKDLGEIVTWVNDNKDKVSFDNYTLTINNYANIMVERGDIWATIMSGQDIQKLSVISNTICSIADILNLNDKNLAEPLPPSGGKVLKEPRPKISTPDFSLMNTIDPTVNFDIAALYSFLISEGVIKDIDIHLFSECITHAHINLLWDISGKLRERNRLQCLFKMLGSEYYPKQWINKCANNLDVPIKAITNPTRSGATDTFNDKLRKILKVKN